MTPDPAFLFLTPQHREALAGLTYAILQHKGFMVLVGEAGTGKTTLLTKALQCVPSGRLRCSVIMHPTLTADEFLEMVLLDFGIAEIPSSKAQRLWKLRNLLIAGYRAGVITALLVDEAHKLSPEVLEEIRLLGNFEESDRKLLQILLVGQSELDDLLNREDLRQLKQRVALRVTLGPLSVAEVEQYISHRWAVAGGDHPPFSAAAIERIASASRAIPRVINSLCENTLTLALAEGVRQVETWHVQAAAEDLQLAPVEYGGGASEALSDIATASVNDHSLAATKRTGWPKWMGKLGLLENRGTTTLQLGRIRPGSEDSK